MYSEEGISAHADSRPSLCMQEEKRTHRKNLPAEYLAESILDRSFTAKEPNEKWLTDVTEFKYRAGGKSICV